jgi:hypothetical protein
MAGMLQVRKEKSIVGKGISTGSGCSVFVELQGGDREQG